jgi:hypothetical protein
MKLNFWQILGALLVIIGIIGIVYVKDDGKKKPPVNDPTPALPATQPATAPTTQI